MAEIIKGHYVATMIIDFEIPMIESKYKGEEAISNLKEKLNTALEKVFNHEMGTYGTVQLEQQLLDVIVVDE